MNRGMHMLIGFRLGLIVLLVAFGQARAQVNLPPINLGNTSFRDGLGGPGTIIQETFVHFNTKHFTDNRGHNIPGDNNLSVNVAITLVAHTTKRQLFGGYYGFEATLPLVELDADTDFGLRQQTFGMGDIGIAPFTLQWKDQRLFDKLFSHRLALVFKLPTGEYHASRPLNPGTNYYSFNPYYAISASLSEALAMSMRFHFLLNGKNTRPFIGTGLSAGLRHELRDTQAGQAFHFNYALSYRLSPHWRLGIAGYYLKQLTRNRENGAAIADDKEGVFALGPGIRYHKQGFTVRGTTYFESAARNRPQGHRFVLSVAQVF